MIDSYCAEIGLKYKYSVRLQTYAGGPSEQAYYHR